MKPGEKSRALWAGLLALKSLFKKAVFFSFFTNMLVVAPTIYMLEVYDRVVNSRSGMTLAMLTVLVLSSYVIMEILQWVRGGILQQAALKFDTLVAEQIFSTVFEANLRRIPGANGQVLNDLRNVREFLSSYPIMAMMDVPLAMIYVLAVFFINSYMGMVSIIGALLQVALAWLTERSTQPPLAAANRAAIDAQNYAAGTLRNAQVIEALGMERGIHQRWLKKQNEFLVRQAEASDEAGKYAAISKFVQSALSSLLLGAGCWLTLKGWFPGGGGMMIVASTLGGKVLSPIVQLIASWRQVVNARDAYARLDKIVEAVELRKPGMPLPAPKGNLSVEGVVAGAPGSTAAILKGLSFSVPTGKMLAVVGPVASGKSTIARLLVGVWPAANGKVRLDGVDIYPWSKSELGPHLGYLPQDVELFEGTLAENIARFGEVDMAKVEAAAKAVGIHDTLLALPQEYDTNIGDDGCLLSGGQRQRVGLARAIYGNPRLVILDEPNSSLDEAGEAALVNTLLALKAQGTTLVVITHRTSVLAAADLMLVLQDGQAKAFGPRDDVLAALQRASQPAAPAPVGVPAI